MTLDLAACQEVGAWLAALPPDDRLGPLLTRIGFREPDAALHD